MVTIFTYQTNRAPLSHDSMEINHCVPAKNKIKIK